MIRNAAQRRPRPLFRSRLRQSALFHRPAFDRLEDRTMLDSGALPAAIVVGRTLATPSTAATQTPSPSYFIGEVQNNQVTITYSVYNQQADTETGVLLTDTLAPGVSVVSSSVTLDGTTTLQPADQSGQNLAWSLAPIQGYDRESVALTVNLPALGANQTTPFAIDAGAQAYAMLDAGAVSASTPAATLQSGNVSDPSLLASTVDADTNDPYIQEEAAALSYGPTQIFNFLHTQIGYNSYLGSVRGARGTLWSNAGNALDVASLGVALMRASGMPAQYVSGTLSQSQAQELILSMFPPQYQTVGYVPAGTQVSDPADDPQLLSESESHYWFQFDTGSGMTGADPLVPGATIGQTFTTSNGTFSAMPDDLEEKTEVQLVAEIYSQANAAFGLNALQDTTVLDQTFDDDCLVGRPITVGNFVSQSGMSAILTSVTNTYTPYIDLGDEAFPDGGRDETLTGTPYQEVLTNFPLDAEILTGLFLNVTLSGPQAPAEMYQHTILDRIGFAARQGLVAPGVGVSPSAPPALENFDVTTVNVLAGLQGPSVPVLLSADLSSLQTQLQGLADPTNGTVPATTQIANLLTQLSTGYTRLQGESDLATSDALTAELATNEGVLAYSARPRIVVTSIGPTQAPASNAGPLATAIDLLDDRIQTIPFPGQASNAAFNFNVARGLTEDSVEYEVTSDGMNGGTPLSAGAILAAAKQQGIPLAVLTSADIAELASFDLPAEATARITQTLQAGQIVLVPSAPVMLGGQATAAWFQTDPSTGYSIGVMENGAHGGIEDFAAANLGALVLIGVLYGPEVAAVDFFLRIKGAQNPREAKTETLFVAGGIVTGGSVFSKFLPPNTTVIVRAAVFAYGVTIAALGFLTGVDPSISPELSDLAIPLPLPVNVSDTMSSDNKSVPSGAVSGHMALTSINVSSQVAASWSNSSTSNFQVQFLSVGSGTLLGAGGQSLGAGAVSVAAATPVSISGSGDYAVNGQGGLSLYDCSEPTLGVSGNWQKYTATVTGNVSLTLTVPAGALALNGRALPAGTYTITTSSATLSGSGTTSSPNFAGTASITATNGTLNLGPGSGTLSVGGKPVNLDDETTLDGYTGTITVSANGDGTDAVSLNGNAGNVLQVAASPPPQPSPTSGGGSYMTDQNTPITFATNVQSNLADTYNLTANAPAGWTVSIDTKGNVTATPAPGLQSGTYPIQIIAQSQTDSNLEAQTTVDVTIKPTQPGINFTVASDPQFTVPYSGAQLPTAFRARFQNLGPAADTYDLTFSNVPTGFTLLDSGTSVTVPAGATGILGIYLQPNTGQPIPPPGTQLSFTVTATSTNDSSITQAQTVTFTVPNIDAVTVTSNPTSVNTTPGAPVTATLTLTDVGNVPETVSLAATLPTGLTASALTPVTLAVGQSTTETITLTPAASTPLNSTLDATITATFGPSASPETQTVQIPVSVGVPGAAAIADAAVAAGQLGNTNLADRLNDLSTALTNLVQNPTSAIYQSQAQASLTAVVGLLGSDPYLSALVPALQADATNLAQATSANAVETAVSRLGSDLDTVGTTLTDEAAHGLSLSFLSNTALGEPQVPATYQILVQNTGLETTTYDLSLGELPAGVTGSINPSSVTLAPGESTLIGTGATSLKATITSTSADTLPSFSFSLSATVEGAPEITRDAVGEFAARPASVQVVSVDTNPPFTDPGGPVDVSAEILDVVNEQEAVSVSYTVTGPEGDVVFTSQPVATTLSVLSALSTTDLGTFDTTNLATGEYVIAAAVDDSSGTPISGATGTGSLLVGTPVTASLSTAPVMLPAGSGAVTSTLQIGASGESGATTAQFTVPGTSDPFLAGMPAGSTAAGGDTAPAESPVQVVGIPIVAGSQLTFTASGETSYEPGVPGAGPDGIPTYFDSHSGGAQNGIGDLLAPVDSLLGVFLGPDQPDGSAAPPALNFSTGGNVAGGVNYAALTPALKQVFFIGDGLTSAGTPRTITVPAGATRFYLATMDGFGWNNNTGSFKVQVTLQTNPGVSIQAQAVIPTANGVTIDPSSFSVAPTSVTTNSNNTETLEWDIDFPAGSSSQTITWQSDVTGLQPGQSLTVDQGATVQFTDQGTPGTLTLPAQYVTGEQIIGLNPPAQTVAPAAPASYDVTLLNPTNSQVTYDLSVQGVPEGWVNLPSSVTVAANGSRNVPLVLTSTSFAALDDYGFTVTANGSNGADASVQGDLILQGQPILPDAQSHGIVATLTPTQASAGQGTSAQYAVQLTNTGSADDTFSLAAMGLPGGVTATFGEATIDVPPGASNSRDVPLTLTTHTGTAPASYPFTMTAASTTDSSITSTANGTLTVVAGGVRVSLNPGSGAPGSSFQETVTNTGTTTDTYKLALAGPAALVASLGMKQVTLAPGASQVVPISTGAVNFADRGNMSLMASATSTSKPAIEGAATANLAIPSSQGMTASFSPASKTLPKPGMTTFLLLVHSTGNTQDSYSATIMGAKGPVTATLVGLDGSPTQSIPTFILPGLSTGAIELQADLSKVGTGTVTVEVQSLTNAAVSASPTATVGAVSPNGPEVTDVQRFGYHMMPTTVVLTFDQTLDAITADNPKNYTINGPAGGKIRVKSAEYNPANDTVTLRPSQRINIHHRYTLVVDGKSAGAISNTQGQLLDSQAGDPGSNYSTPLTWRNLVLNPPSGNPTTGKGKTLVPPSEVISRLVGIPKREQASGG